jgi:hypothetical protein
MRITFGSLGDAEAGPREALVVALLAGLHVAQGCVGEYELAGGKAAGVVGPHVGARAEERDLEAEQPLACLQGAGEVPPLGAGGRVGAEVGRESQRARGDQRGSRLQARCEYGQSPQEVSAFHLGKHRMADDNAGLPFPSPDDRLFPARRL